MKFLLFDREEKYIGNLKDVLEAKQTEEINGEDVLELTVLEQQVENISDEWGRNLLLDSEWERSADSITNNGVYYAQDLNSLRGEIYTLSFDAMSTNPDDVLHFGIARNQGNTSQRIGNNFKATDTYKRHTFTFYMNEEI